ncbi:Coenzyme PQQ synthesis protein E [uncultured archaeon]|nr:Coenzyme PQQ synthesis protein E [uncultured archaeon]
MKINVDNHKLMYHPKRVDEWSEKGDCFPIYVEIGPTNNCNHRCKFCALDWLKHGIQEIDRDVMISTLKDMAEHGVKSVMFAGEGESLLHKDIGLFVQKAKEYGLDVSITTNGVAFTKEKMEQCLPNLSWIRFSVNAGSPETYSFLHQTNLTDFEKVIDNIKQAVRFRNENGLKTTIGVQIVMLPDNIDEILKLAEILKNIGADNLQLKPYSHHPKTKNFFELDKKEYDKLEEIKKLNSDTFEVLFRKETIERLEEGITYPRCYGLSFFSLIDSRGNVLPCNRFYNSEEFIYGNIHQQSFSDIWQGDKRKEVSAKIKLSECGKGCKLDVCNKYLYRIKNPHPHDNFI